ncbi:hypothetical protein HOC35_01905 [Candidatus Woesearchaeota archaeon]|jgi:hypothetical protein|nr:hypothetical protein [Candidatus Woesearchaeota archaeon]
MIPNLFSKYPLPEKLPKTINEVVKQLKKSKNKEQCLKEAYQILIKKYRGYKILTYLKFHHAFITNLNQLWLKSGFLHCTQMNYLLRLLLVKSKHFKEKDIVPKYSLTYYTSPHQYLQVRIGKMKEIDLENDKFVNVDIWGAANGIKFGDYANGFFKSK